MPSAVARVSPPSTSLPRSVRKLYKEAFKNCLKLADVKIRNSNIQLVDLWGDPIDNNEAFDLKTVRYAELTVPEAPSTTTAATRGSCGSTRLITTCPTSRRAYRSPLPAPRTPQHGTPSTASSCRRRPPSPACTFRTARRPSSDKRGTECKRQSRRGKSIVACSFYCFIGLRGWSCFLTRKTTWKTT